MLKRFHKSLFVFVAFSTGLAAQPSGSVMQGHIYSEAQGKKLVLNASEGTTIEWDSFSIDPDETLHIVLPSKESRIEFHLLSEGLINGNLTSNGSIALNSEKSVVVKGFVQCEGDLTVQAPTITNRAVIKARNILLKSVSDGSDKVSIDNKGLIQAKKAGRIEMIAEAGRVIQRNTLLAESGRVVLTGDVVQLQHSSLIDVSGPEEGGDVFIGGGWQGQDSTINNARATFVNTNARIVANSRENGDGGTVVIWGDRLNRFLGSVSAEGAGLSGKGGDVEVSAKGELTFDGKVNVSAPYGACGTVLLDPTSITINANPPANINGTPGTDITSANEVASAATYPGINSIITSGALNNLLTGTPATATLSAVSFITVNDPITATGPSPVNLVLNAPTINLNAPISLPFGGTLDGSAGIVNVGPTGTVQNGVDTAGSSSVVNLSAGTYQEQVLITTPLTLNGAGMNATTIKAPASVTNNFTVDGINIIPVLMVSGATGLVNVQNLTVDGDLKATGGATARFCAIGYQNTDGAVINVHTTNTATSFPTGTQGNGSGIIAATDTSRHEFHAVSCLVERFERQGIFIFGVGNPAPNNVTIGANVLNNTILGASGASGATGFGSSGVQFAVNIGGAPPTLPLLTGTVANNYIQNMQTNSPIAPGNIGLLITGATSPSIYNNTMVSNDFGMQITNCLNPFISNNTTMNSSSLTATSRGIGYNITANSGTTTLLSNSSNADAVAGIFLTPSINSVTNLQNNTITDSAIGLQIASPQNSTVNLSKNTFTRGTIGVFSLSGATAATGPRISFDQDVFIGPFSTSYISITAPNPYTGTFYLEP